MTAFAGGDQATPLPTPRPVQDRPIAEPQPIQQAQPHQQQPMQVAQAGQNGPSMPQLYRALQNPWLNDTDRQIISGEINRLRTEADPATQMAREKARLELDRLRGPQQDWSKLDDGRLYNQRTGEIRDVSGGAAGKATEYGLNPQYGVDAQGNPVLIQMGKDGTSVRTPLPEGVQLSKEPIKLDAGTHFVLLDPITRQPVGQVPKENRDAARETAIGKAEGEATGDARASLSTVREVGTQITSQIDDVLNDPNLDSSVGSVQGRLPSFRQGAVDFDKKLERLQGQAFLQARQFLKGQGQITDFESRRAEAAMAQLSTAQSEEQFRAALEEFKAAVQSGVQKAEMNAGRGGAAPAPSPAPAADGWQDIGGVKIRKKQ